MYSNDQSCDFQVAVKADNLPFALHLHFSNFGKTSLYRQENTIVLPGRRDEHLLCSLS